MRMLAAAATLPALLVLTSCAAAAPAPAEAEPAADPCVFLAGGAYEDAVDVFLAYSTSPTSVDAGDVTSVLDRLEQAEQASSGDLADALGTAATEFAAIETRLSGGDPLTPVDYQSLKDALDVVGAECSPS